jgi:hypothetical protein
METQQGKLGRRFVRKMIRINHHCSTPRGHIKNTGLGNKLVLNFLARSLSIENNEPLENWMQTKLYAGTDGDYDGIERDKWGYIWPYINHNESNTTIVGRGTNCGYGDEYHQNSEVVELIAKYKDVLVKDFGKRSGVFVHVRWGDLATDRRWSDICNYEYYAKCLSDTNYKKGYLASDTLDHPFIQKLLNEFNLEFYQATPEETIIFGSMFDNKILSLGTFSWWIGFVGNQNNVMHPDQNNYRRWHGPIFDPVLSWNKVSKPYEKNN